MALAWTSDNIAKILSGEIKATTPTATPTATAKPTSGFGSSTGNGIKGYDKYGSGITPEMQTIIDNYVRKPGDGEASGGGYMTQNADGSVLGTGIVPDWMGYMTNFDGSQSGRGGVYAVQGSGAPSSGSYAPTIPTGSLTPQQQISQLGQDWQNTTDPTIRAQLNARANDLRTQLGLVAGVDYNPATGGAVQAGTGLAPVGGATNLLGGGYQQQAATDPLQAITNLINSMGQNKAPTYQVPDYASIIPAPVKGVAATARAGDTTFVPTARYNDRALQYRQEADNNAYNTYNANLAGYNANQGTIQDQLNSLLNLLPYSQLTAAQKATAAQNEAEAALDRQIREAEMAWEKDPTNIDNRYKEAQIAAMLGKSVGSSGGGGGGATGGGGTTTSSAVDVPGTAGERQAKATSQMLNSLYGMYSNNTSSGLKYPAYYAIKGLLANPDAQQAAIMSGGSIKTAIDSFIVGQLKMTPSAYFATPSGSSLKSLYSTLAK